MSAAPLKEEQEEGASQSVPIHTCPPPMPPPTRPPPTPHSHNPLTHPPGEIRTSLDSTLHTLCKGSFKRLLEQGRWNTDSKGQGIGEFSSHKTTDGNYERINTKAMQTSVCQTNPRTEASTAMRVQEFRVEFD